MMKNLSRIESRGGSSSFVVAKGWQEGKANITDVTGTVEPENKDIGIKSRYFRV